MAKEKGRFDDEKNKVCSSVFKNKTLTKEDYTQIWVELITALENRKSVNFFSSQ